MKEKRTRSAGLIRLIALLAAVCLLLNGAVLPAAVKAAPAKDPPAPVKEKEEILPEPAADPTLPEPVPAPDVPGPKEDPFAPDVDSPEPTTKKEEELPTCKHDRDWDIEPVDLTPDAKCGETKRIQYVCAYCGEPFVEEYVIEHDWDWDGTVLNPEVTKCGAIRKTEYTCLNCGATRVEETVIEHQYDYKNPTFLNPGETCDKLQVEYHCRNCNETMISKKGLEHSFDDGDIIKEAVSCQEKGTIARTCTRCGVKEYTYFDGPHSYGKGTVIQEPTPEEPGVIRCVCKLCGDEAELDYGYPVAAIEITAQEDLYENISGATYGYREVSASYGGNGSAWSQYDDYGFFRYDLDRAKLTYKLTLQNGDVLDHVPWYYTLTLNDGQSADTPWKTGKHTVTAVLSRGGGEKMCETKFTVELLPCPISAVTASFTPAVPTDYSDYAGNYEDDTGTTDRIILKLQNMGNAYSSNPPALLLHTLLTVTYTDGTVETIFASEKYSYTFTLQSIEPSEDGYTVNATWCGFPLGYTVPVTAPYALPETEASLSGETIPAEWQSVDLPADIMDPNSVRSLTANGDCIAFLYSDGDWNTRLAVMDKTKKLSTQSVNEILRKELTGEYYIEGISLTEANGKFFLSAAFSGGSYAAANGWKNHILLVSEDLKSFSAVKLPQLPKDTVDLYYNDVQIRGFCGKYLLTNGRLAAVSSDLKTWSELYTMPGDDSGWTETYILGTTDRGALIGEYWYTDGTVIPYLDGLYYTGDFKTFTPVEIDASPAALCSYLGCDNDRGLINLIVEERLQGFRGDEHGYDSYMSLTYVQFNEKTLKTVEKQVYQGSFSNWSAWGNDLIYCTMEKKEGSAAWTVTQSGRPVAEVRLPYSLKDAADDHSFTFTDEGKKYSAMIMLMKDDNSLLFTDDAYRTLYRFRGPAIPDTEDGYSGTISWMSDCILIIADRIYYCSNDLFEPYLKNDISQKLKEFPGDVDGDNKVTSADARLALRASVGLEELAPDTAGFINADANHNGKIGSDDARLILRASVGLEELD